MRFLFVSGLAAATIASGIGAASASQVEDRLRQGVIERDRPAYTARGIRAGSFLLYPALDLSLAYDDNIFATDGNEVDDFVFETRPQLAFESNFPRHAVYGRVDLKNLTYFDQGSEDRTDYFLGGGTRVDIKRQTNWNTDVEWQRDHEDRGSPDAVGLALDPVTFRRTQITSELRHRPGRLDLTGGGLYQRYTFDNVDLLGGGVQNNEDRDRSLYGGYGRVGYELSPGYELFVLGLYSTIDYDQSFDDNGFNRDSNGYQFEGGARFELTNVIAGEASVGYLNRNYADPRLETVSGVSTEVDVQWYVSRLTTIHFGASRRVQETTIFGASGYLETAFETGVDHELLRNIILSAYFRYGMRDYRGISREDDQVDVTGRVLYLINRNFSLAAEYRHQDRNSNVPGEDFGRNVAMLTLRAQI